MTYKNDNYIIFQKYNILFMGTNNTEFAYSLRIIYVDLPIAYYEDRKHFIKKIHY